MGHPAVRCVWLAGTPCMAHDNTALFCRIRLNICFQRPMHSYKGHAHAKSELRIGPEWTHPRMLHAKAAWSPHRQPQARHGLVIPLAAFYFVTQYPRNSFKKETAWTAITRRKTAGKGRKASLRKAWWLHVVVWGWHNRPAWLLDGVQTCLGEARASAGGRDCCNSSKSMAEHDEEFTAPYSYKKTVG